MTRVNAYYNEIDEYAARWLRNLIAAGHIAPGLVDERSIKDVRPQDLTGFTQCHFFAGIGVWSYALRLAGWPDDRPVWTGSCPCQPFSAAGKGKGFADERHLWPEFHRLISECQPGVVFGEQVASKDGLAWLDLVQSDLEGEGYACGPVDTCAAGFGAPHIRQRLYWAGVAGLADAEGGKRSRLLQEQSNGPGPRGEGEPDRGCRDPRRLADNDEAGLGLEPAPRLHDDGAPRNDAHGRGGFGGMGDADGERQGALGRISSRTDAELGRGVSTHRMADHEGGGRVEGSGPDRGTVGTRNGSSDGCIVGYVGRPGPTNGLWAAPDWLFCRDGKWRPVESGTQPLAHGAPARVGRLRAYGNAIVAQAAAEVISAFMECRP